MMLSTLLLVESGTAVNGKVSPVLGQIGTNGLALSIIAMGVVFISLILLFIAIKYIARTFNVDMNKFFGKNRPEAVTPESSGNIPGETLAAISLALHLYHKQVQGMEEAVMTFRNVSKTYSPWSSKIYGLRQNPKR